MEGFEYEASIKDEMSGPADDIKESLKHLAAEMMAVKQAKLDATFRGNAVSARAAGLEIQRLALEQHKLNAELKAQPEKGGGGFIAEIGKSLVPEIAAGELAAEAIKKVGEAAMEAAEKLADLFVEGTRFAIEASDFKEDTIAAYEAIGDTAEEGEEAFAEIDKLSDALHMPAEKAHDLAKTLMIEGLEDQKQVVGAIEAVSNLQRAGLEQGANKFQSLISRSLAAGHFDYKSKMLRSAGVSDEDVYSGLAKRLNKSVDQVKLEMKKGQIAVDVGIASIEDLINNSKAADIARKKFDMSDVEVDLSNSFRKMFQDIDISPLMAALRDFVSIFSDGSASADTMKDVITSVFGTIIRWVALAVEEITEFILEAEIGALEAYIAFFPLIDILARIEHGAELVAKQFLGIGSAAENMDAIKFMLTLSSGGIGSMPALGFDNGHEDVNKTSVHEDPPLGKEEKTVAKAHASGGTVMQPAPGEVFASVAPGEVIVPSRFASQIPAFGSNQGSPGGVKSGGAVTVHVDVGGIEMHGVHDMAKLRPMLESEIADVFERVALEMGA